VEFDGQTVHLSADAGEDRLDVQFVYRDLHSSEADPARALKHLERLRAGERWVAFASNFPFMVNVDSIADDAVPDQPARARFIHALDERVELRPGPLWLDDGGRLCGTQLLRVGGLADLIARLDASLRETMSDPEARARFYEDLDEESRERLAAAAAGGHEFFSLRGAAVACTLPISDGSLAEMKRKLLRDALEEAGEAWAQDPEQSGERRELEAGIEFLALNEWAVERSDGYVTFVLGDPRTARWTMEIPPVGRKRHDTLLPALREAGWTIHGPEGDGAARAAWEAFVAEE
jgi:hypothetical protein